MKRRFTWLIIGATWATWASCAVCAQASDGQASDVRAAKPLMRGSLITPDDLKLSSGYSLAKSDVMSRFVGMEVRRTIYDNAVIRDTDVRAPIIVHRNARVQMRYKFGSLEILGTGRALDEGALGDIIPILNTSSRQKVEGRVIGASIVDMVP